MPLEEIGMSSSDFVFYFANFATLQGEILQEVEVIFELDAYAVKVELSLD